MSHNIGDAVGHSTRGNGSITAVKSVTKSTPVDRVKLIAEEGKLRIDQARIVGRLAEIERLKAAPGDVLHEEIAKYTVTFAGGRTLELEGWEVDKLKTRIT